MNNLLVIIGKAHARPDTKTPGVIHWRDSPTQKWTSSLPDLNVKAALVQIAGSARASTENKK